VKDQPLIELHRVDVKLDGTRVLRNVTWALRRGEHWMIRGANGSGKSTFLRLLRGEVWPAPKRGDRIYRLDGTTQMTAIEVRRHIALVAPESQERYLQQEWRMTARDVIHTGFAQSDMLYVKLTREQKRHTELLARKLGITPLLARDMQTLSTGELRKVLIARAVVGHPKLLLLDEVCDGLDAKFRRELLCMIEKIARHGTQIIYTTHRQDEALSVITHVAEFEQGRMTRQGAFTPQRAASVPLARPQVSGENFHQDCDALPLTPTLSRREREKASQRPSSRTRPALVRRNAVPPLPAGEGRGEGEAAESSQPFPSGDQARQTKRQRDAGGTLIRIENADVFLDRKKVLQGIRWELRRGEHWAVLGGNGAGKTTFLKLIASDLYPMFGARVSRFEFTADDTIWDLRRRIGCVSPLLQTHYREQLTAERVVVSGFFSSVGLMDKPTAAQLRRARALLSEFDLLHLRTKSMLALSFGELRKVLTLRALVHDPELLIFDEPFDGLDAESRQDFARALEHIANKGTQLIVVTHHLDDLPRCITHGLFLQRGKILTADDWSQVRRHAAVKKMFGYGPTPSGSR
jgi:molybdate transport system ATP-binding protein